MNNVKTYAVWNNKGGVGKSTITFHLATRYAEKNPNTNVLIIDLCPQANSSMMLLGGGNSGETHVLELCTAATPKTVVGYLSTVIARGPGAELPDPRNYAVRISDRNDKMPSNMFLLCGDGNLEPMSPAISGAASAPTLTPEIQPWKWVHQIFTKFVSSLARIDNKDLTVFIDTNPSFSIYTELAVSAAEKLIAPVNADDSSRIATNAMFILLHGQVPPHPVYGSWTYAAQAKKYGLEVPLIHVIVGNRLTQYDGAANAFHALSEATADTLFKGFTNNPSYFSDRSVKPMSLEEFRASYSVPLRDFNTAGVVSSHLGRPLSGMGHGYYDVQGTSVWVNAERIKECSKALDQLIEYID
jgi:cellulose biosynthesis protein BcsQ